MYALILFILIVNINFESVFENKQSVQNNNSNRFKQNNSILQTKMKPAEKQFFKRAQIFFKNLIIKHKHTHSKIIKKKINSFIYYLNKVNFECHFFPNENSRAIIKNVQLETLCPTEFNRKSSKIKEIYTIYEK